jgi:hypothetical protein
VFTKEKLEISGSSFRVLFLCTWIIPVITTSEWQPSNLTVESLDALNTTEFADLSPCDFWLFGFLK